ncbi:hypothetical protein GCM10022420_000590 [Streptomyces iranensis]|uniref:FAD-dependent pyridine nucleotide-disulfideoxidoreductase n=1 Tax=Streptomyces iranensis TaxID=576784 RepID=A0A060ZPU1_9ACTN|nr:hypothetical protein [Streptomyces iranensis]CDR07871.1 FAD-dependent pyridine nucleotide-disulfideoxidoreductase [Streptomyces iranensis]
MPAVAQRAFLAPDVFAMYGEEALLYDARPDDARRAARGRAAGGGGVPGQGHHRGGRGRQVDGGPGGCLRWRLTAPWSGSGARATSSVVGASLAGLRAAETLREEGFTGTLTMIGDEPYEPYDRLRAGPRRCW